MRESTRGAAIITLAKGWFLITGFAQPLVLTKVLSPEQYGLYGVVLNLISIVNNLVVAGSIQSMSKAVTEGGAPALRRGLVVHLAVGVALSGLLVLSAPFLGATVLGDPRLPSLLRIGAIIVFNYSLYAALVGSFNGQRAFVTQAGLDMLFATLRTGLIIGAAALGFGVAGSVGGFAFASSVILLLSLVLARGALRGGGESGAVPQAFVSFAGRYARSFAPILLYQLALNLVLQSDLLVMKALLSRRADLGGVDAVNALAGVYKAVQSFAFLPYQLLLAVTFVVFPVVSRATLDGDRETTATFVRGTVRFSMLALGAMLAVLTGLPRGVLLVATRREFADGAMALRLLSIGQGFFALSVIATTILVAAGRTALATGCMLAMLVAVATGNTLGIGLATTGIGAVTATALGTLCGCALGLTLIGWQMHKLYGAFLPPATALRVVGATAGAAALVAAVPLQGKVVTLGLAGVAVLLYGLFIALSRELTGAEMTRIARLVRRR